MSREGAMRQTGWYRRSRKSASVPVNTETGAFFMKMACASRLFHFHNRYYKVFAAAVLFAKQETILPAPESAHAIRTAIDEAKTILFGLTGTGYFDMTAYDAYLNKTMTDYIPSDEDLRKGFAKLPEVK